MAQLGDPTQGRMSPELEKAYQAMVGPRGRIDGMYRTMLNHPALAGKVAELGAFLRFGEHVLPADLREMVILAVARRLGAAYEWVKHVPPAREAGVDPALIEDLRCGREPTGQSPLARGILAAVDQVLAARSLPADLQDALQSELGAAGLVELVVLVGFYRMIAGFLFAFEVPLPPGEIDPFGQ